MPEAILYPHSINTDKSKLLACYSLIQQTKDEANRQSEIASKNPKLYADKLRAYTHKEITPALRQLSTEEARLKKQIWSAVYTEKQWQKIGDMECSDIDAWNDIMESLFGVKGEEVIKPTLATSPVLGYLKKIDVTKYATLAAPPDPYENFYADYTEVDVAGNKISIVVGTPYRITFTNMDRDETCYVNRDMGRGYFRGDFYIKARFRPVDAFPDGIFHFCSLSEESGNAVNLITGNRIRGYWWGRTARRITLTASGGSSVYDETGLVQNTVYYMDLERVDCGGATGTGQVTLKVCSGNYYGESGYSLKTNLSTDTSVKNDYRWLWGLSSYNSGHAALNSTGWVDNMDVQVPVYSPRHGFVNAQIPGIL